MIQSERRRISMDHAIKLRLFYGRMRLKDRITGGKKRRVFRKHYRLNLAWCQKSVLYGVNGQQGNRP